MKPLFKVVVPIALIVLVVFGVTFISQYSSNTKKDDGNDPTKITGQPLEFRLQALGYDPNAEDIELRSFEAFHEKSDKEVLSSFWFRNPHPVPIRLWALGRSCAACTNASVAVVPPEPLKALTVDAKSLDATSAAVLASFFPSSAIGVPNLASAFPAVPLNKSLQWTVLDFGNQTVMVTIPPAPNPDTPTQGIFRMHVQVNVEGPKPLSVGIAAAVGEQPPTGIELKAAYVGLPPFLLHPTAIKLGDLPEGASPRSETLYYWSATRGLPTNPAIGPDLPPPVVAVDKGDFLQVSKAEPLSPEETDALTTKLITDGKQTRVKGAYKLTATIRRQVATPSMPGGPTEPDVGPFDKRISFAGPNGSVGVVPVTATITGLVSIYGDTSVKLGSFNATTGIRKTVKLVSDRTDLDLAATEESTPPLQIALGSPKDENGQRYWDLTVTVPEKQGAGPLPSDAHVVLLAKTGARSVRVRLPVSGTAQNK